MKPLKPNGVSELSLGVLILMFPLSRCLIGQQRYILRESTKEPPFQHPPLIVVVGTAQTADSWSFHLPMLSQERSVLLYEPLGLGPHFDKKATPDVSLDAQVDHLLKTVKAAFPGHTNELDLAGFSLGGRIAMAAAAVSNVRKLHLTGVALHRSVEGLEELDRWKRLLRQDDMPGFAEAAIKVSYYNNNQELSSEKLRMGIAGVCQNHKADGLLALLEQAHDEEGPYSVASMAKRLKRKAGGQLVVGEHDLLAPKKQVERLATQLGWKPPTVMEGAGHAVPFEASRQWRKSVLDYLNTD